MVISRRSPFAFRMTSMMALLAEARLASTCAATSFGARTYFPPASAIISPASLPLSCAGAAGRCSRHYYTLDLLT